MRFLTCTEEAVATANACAVSAVVCATAAENAATVCANAAAASFEEITAASAAIAAACVYILAFMMSPSAILRGEYVQLIYSVKRSIQESINFYSFHFEVDL